MTFASTKSKSPKSITLETVKAQLEHWRATSPKGARIPKHLWESISSLTKHYHHNHIASELKVNRARLRAKIDQPPQPGIQPRFQHQPQTQLQQAALANTNFIELPISHLTHSFPSPPFSPAPPYPSSPPSLGLGLELTPEQTAPKSYTQGTIELTRPDGVALKASGLGRDDLCSFIKSFLA